VVAYPRSSSEARIVGQSSRSTRSSILPGIVN
jgi:hypothetical protein